MRRDRAHVVQAVGELDQDDPDVRGHRDHHLAVVLGLGLVARLEGQAGQLGDAVDETGDLLAERLAHLLERGRGVLDRVVQERGAQGVGVEPHPRADLGHADRMDDEVLARAAGADRRGARRRTRTPPRPGRGRSRRRPRARAPRRSRTGRRAAGARPASARSARPRLPCASGCASRSIGDREPGEQRRARRVHGRSNPPRPSGGPGSTSWEMICAAQESSTILVPLSVDPVRRRALQRRRRGARDRQGRQVPVEADELELREDLDQPCRQACRATVRTVSAKQVLELLAGRPSPQPEAAVKSHERSTETVLQLVHLLRKA